MKEENLYESYPINRLSISFSKNTALDYIEKEEQSVPFLKINTDRIWIDPIQLEESIILITSNTEWTVSTSEEIININNLNLKKENYVKTELANSNSWKWEWKW